MISVIYLFKKVRNQATSSDLGFSSPSANVVTNEPEPQVDPQAIILQAAENYFAEIETAKQNQENAVTTPPAPAQDPTITKLIAELQELKASIATGTTTPTPNPKRKKKEKGERKYCWTHGWCAHAGADCKNPAEGHKNEATNTNMMGGSTKNCFWIKEDSA